MVLVVVGLLDIGVLIYCIANGISYSSSQNIFAVIAGLFLLRGSLVAAGLCTLALANANQSWPAEGSESAADRVVASRPKTHATARMIQGRGGHGVPHEDSPCLIRRMGLQDLTGVR